jgi:hypothetical protein
MRALAEREGTVPNGRRGSARALLAAAVCLALPGCVLKVPPVSLQMNVARESGGAASEAVPAALYVAELEDQRPAPEREGRKARGWFFYLWNSRIGTYITGDQDFTAPVGKAAAAAIVDALRASGRFRAVGMLEPFDAPAQGAEGAGSGEYVLRGQILHLYGTQYQRAIFTMIPIGWLMVNEVTAPTGHSVIRFELFERGPDRIVWSETLGDTCTEPTYTRNSNAAFAHARLANRLAETLAAVVAGSPPPAAEVQPAAGEGGEPPVVQRCLAPPEPEPGPETAPAPEA